jgi:hypothetical protein
MSLCNISLVELLLFLLRVFRGISGENSCNVFLLFFMLVLWFPIFTTLCMRAVLMLWHAFLFLARAKVFSSFLHFAWWSPRLLILDVRFFWSYHDDKGFDFWFMMFATTESRLLPVAELPRVRLYDDAHDTQFFNIIVRRRASWVPQHLPIIVP